MSNYAWANPTNGLREQDDNLTRAIGRVQAEIKAPAGEWAHAVIVYQQQPRYSVERDTAYSVAPKQRTRLLDWPRMKLRRAEKEKTDD